MIQKFAVIGHPIGHTMSPFIHTRLFELSGLNTSYSVMDIHPNELKTSMEKLKQLNGFNVTIPHKETILPFIDRLDASAKTYNAVNCIKNDNGVLTGYSTDAYGFSMALELNGITPSKNILILGSGGAARTIAKELCNKGCHVTLAVRSDSLKKAYELKKWLNLSGGTADVTNINAIQGNYTLCVNATPSGMYPNIDEMPIDTNAISQCDALFDAVYNPADTLLIKTFNALGKKTVGGMPMLVLQAVKAHEHWYGGSFCDQDIKQLISDANKEMARIFNEK